MFTPGAQAATVFLVLYAILWLILLSWFLQKKIKINSVYSILLFHIFIRLSAQGCGIAFGIVGYRSLGLLVAYLVLGAEGYFTLVLCSYRFLIAWHQHNLASGESFLEPKLPKEWTFLQRLKESFSIRHLRQSHMSYIHWLMIAANVMIITGGNMQTDALDPNESISESQIHTAKALRITGQAIFLAINLGLGFSLARTFRMSKAELGFVHPTVKLLAVAWPFLIVRGAFGILQATVNEFSYYNLDSYDANGLTRSFIIGEYLLSVSEEWISCALLMCTFLTSRYDEERRAERLNLKTEKTAEKDGNQ